MKYRFIVKGLNSRSGTISMRALKYLVDALMESSERSLRLAIQGESVKPGPLPVWLTQSLNFTITDLQKGSTTILVEAPELGQTAPEFIKQQDLWYSSPDPEDTAITLISRSVREASDENVESNAFDTGVLDGLLLFESFFTNHGNRLIVQAVGRSAENFSLGCDELEHVKKLKVNTPQPIALVISGQFDVIQHSRRKFQLLLGNHQIIPGVLDSNLSVEGMRDFWGKAVTIKGIIHFHPGRRVRLLEAQSIKLTEEGEELFNKLPSPPPGPQTLFDLEVPKINAGGALQEIWGRWPGDESIEELLAALTL